jgi:hypothetical protein
MSRQREVAGSHLTLTAPAHGSLMLMLARLLALGRRGVFLVLLLFALVRLLTLLLLMVFRFVLFSAVHGSSPYYPENAPFTLGCTFNTAAHENSFYFAALFADNKPVPAILLLLIRC